MRRGVASGRVGGGLAAGLGWLQERPCPSMERILGLQLSLDLLRGSSVGAVDVLWWPVVATGGAKRPVRMDWGKPLADCCGHDVGGAPASFTFLNAAS